VLAKPTALFPSDKNRLKVYEELLLQYTALRDNESPEQVVQIPEASQVPGAGDMRMWHNLPLTYLLDLARLLVTAWCDTPAPAALGIGYFTSAAGESPHSLLVSMHASLGCRRFKTPRPTFESRV
jgi:hypothetical protein